MRSLRPVLLVLAAATLGAGGYFAYHRGGSAGPTYRTEAVARGNLASTVSATGTLEPEEVIDVGAQVGGMIQSFGTGSDGGRIDYGSPVEAGTVLASIDDALYRAKADQSRASVRAAQSQVASAKAKLDAARANVASAKANTQRAEADVKQAAAKADQAVKDWKRVQSLGNAVSRQEYAAAQSALDATAAAVGVADAAVAQAKAAELNSDAAVADAVAAIATAEAAVATAEALLKQDVVNLDYCTIKSQIKGTILDRRVTLGQTVQSSFSTPSLFLIAKDLTRMRVWASVNEADIGLIRLDMPARFTLDAHPGRTFRGNVARIRLNATNTQNVVVYTVEVTADNADGALTPNIKDGKPAPYATNGKLLPYMTANLAFQIDKREGVLTLPNAALRYKPSGSAAPGPEKSGTKGGDKKEDRHAGTVWVKDGDAPRAVAVKLGLTDGNHTEVVEGDLPEGAEVIVGETAANSAGAGAGTVNPFAAPKMGGGKKQ